MTYPTTIQSMQEIECRRVWGSPPEIYRSEVTGGVDYGASIEGRKFLLRSDFPVLCYLEMGNGRRRVGAAGAPFFPPFYRFELGRHELSPRRAIFRLPTGWGGDPTGGRTLVQSEILGRHGVCCLDAAWNGEADPQLPNPDLLPGYTQVLSNLTGTAGTTNPNWGTVTLASSVFTQNGKLPNEFYLKALAVNVEQTSTYLAAYGVGCYEFQLRKTNTPAGDNQFFMIVTQDPLTHSATHYFHNLKLPLRSIFAPYAAETPTLDLTAFGSLDPLIAPVVHSRLIGNYHI